MLTIGPGLLQGFADELEKIAGYRKNTLRDRMEHPAAARHAEKYVERLFGEDAPARPTTPVVGHANDKDVRISMAPPMPKVEEGHIGRRARPAPATPKLSPNLNAGSPGPAPTKPSKPKPQGSSPKPSMSPISRRNAMILGGLAGATVLGTGAYLLHQRKKWKQMEKQALRAGGRLIQKMVSGGNLAGASRLAQTPGVLKPSVAGSQLKLLGRGSEGSAALVAHPQHGVAVRKLYDPKGIAGPEIIQRKEQIGRAVGENPNMAKFLGSAQTPQGGTMHFNEYVHSGGAAPAAGSRAETQGIAHARTQTQRAIAGTGYGAQDVRKANMAWDQGAGRFKTVDYIPSQKGEFLRSGASTPENRVFTTPKGNELWNKNYDPVSSMNAKPGQLEQQAFGRTPTPAAQPAQQRTPTVVRNPLATAQTAPVGMRIPTSQQSAGTVPLRAAKKPPAIAYAPTMAG